MMDRKRCVNERDDKLLVPFNGRNMAEHGEHRRSFEIHPSGVEDRFEGNCEMKIEPDLDRHPPISRSRISQRMAMFPRLSISADYRLALFRKSPDLRFDPPKYFKTHRYVHVRSIQIQLKCLEIYFV